MTPDKCIVFEDIPAAVEGAKAAGMKVVAVYDEHSSKHREKLINSADKYIEDFFQIFDEDYINSLRKYFVDNAMVAHLLVTVQYFIKIPRFVFLTVLMLSYSIYYCYIGFKPNIIYEDGILINNTLYKWDNIKGFEWGELRERENKAYYDLTVNLPKLYDLNADKKLRINADDRDKISQILNDNIEKSGV